MKPVMGTAGRGADPLRTAGERLDAAAAELDRLCGALAPSPDEAVFGRIESGFSSRATSIDGSSPSALATDPKRSRAVLRSELSRAFDRPAALRRRPLAFQPEFRYTPRSRTCREGGH